MKPRHRHLSICLALPCMMASVCDDDPGGGGDNTGAATDTDGGSNSGESDTSAGESAASVTASDSNASMGGGSGTPDTDDDSSAPTTAGTSESESDDGSDTEETAGEDTSGSGDETSGETEMGTDTDGHSYFDCNPAEADFENGQASITVNVQDGSCATVPGFAKADQFVLDDVVNPGDSYFGSGSGAVMEMTGGTFENQGSFFTVFDMEADQPVEIYFEEFAIHFTIEDANAGSPGAVGAVTQVQAEITGK